jgi:low-affinity ferrous iron transport protein
VTSDRISNETIDVPPPKANRGQKVIFYYVDIIGALVGVAILIIVLIVWVGIGPALQFNGTWSLLIGTYAGLIGLVDGFVLRNVQARLKSYETIQFHRIDEQDTAMFPTLEVPTPPPPPGPHRQHNYQLPHLNRNGPDLRA